ncbi:CRISPR system precrRNA processing endoribonuclease RAMP protein Cas6 [Leptodesmis sichuanensis]|uniref:CRISPR system precrRNA processing endoribonuclease RAMP protein Cas6 n=1 Tax=Leptodesmis sichuanensis TaxID=2906798 RepID=UPI001F2F4ECB|nr:CRISPR system precrRNA processing endoribonuclease RAMP protein Cas6 [Leptodesmis sichuanensis]UIE40011.1 CRISPR system precrRNA processing endoribonuclease RAMP protein Cas6 [Leptodesmis sichuanensis A121]
MTYTKEDPKIAGLTVTLKSLQSATQSIPLTDWLLNVEPSPIWVPLARQQGVTKVMPVSEAHHYSMLMQTICQQMNWSTQIEWQGKFYELAGIEVDTQDLHILEISLSPTKPLSHSIGRAIHAQFFRWLAITNPALAQNLHHQSQLPFALSLIPGTAPKLRISLLQKALLAPLLLGLSQELGQEITLAGVNCRVGKIVNITQTHQFNRLIQALPQEVIELEFVSPTSFKKEQQIQLFPLPEMVFSSLARRWNALAPEELRFPKVQWKSLVAMYELKTKTFQMEGGAEIGSVGWVRYRFPDPEQARMASVLAEFATFAGVGRKTGMGMGQVRIREKRKSNWH